MLQLGEKGFKRQPLAHSTGNPAAVRSQVPRPRWRPIPLLVSHTLALGLVASWIWPTTRRTWDLYDAGVFQALNTTLTGGALWTQLMALANCRSWDLVMALTIGLLLLWNVRSYEKRCPFSGWLSLAVLAVSVWLVKALVCGGVIHTLCGYQRASPTQVIVPCQRVSELVPTMAAKDSTLWSFPGDHGLVLISVALYLIYRGTGRQESLAWLLAIVFGLPRIVVGAHWATDLVVGSASAALLLTAWLLATPLHDRLVQGACWRVANLRAAP